MGRRERYEDEGTPAEQSGWMGALSRLLAGNAPVRAREANKSARDDGTLTREVIASLKENATICAICYSSDFLGGKTLDHIIPLARNGWHSIHNVRITCQPCNNAKGDKLDEEM